MITASSYQLHSALSEIVSLVSCYCHVIPHWRSHDRGIKIVDPCFLFHGNESFKICRLISQESLSSSLKERYYDGAWERWWTYFFVPRLFLLKNEPGDDKWSRTMNSDATFEEYSIFQDGQSKKKRIRPERGSQTDDEEQQHRRTTLCVRVYEENLWGLWIKLLKIAHLNHVLVWIPQ